MARPVDNEKKAALRAAAADYLLTHGLAQFSLRPVADAIGTSARMLIHHFGTREELLREAVEAIRAREQAQLAAWSLRRGTQHGTDATWRWHWRRVSAPQMRATLRNLFELYVVALRDPRQTAWVFEAPLAYWQDVLGQPGRGSPKSATEATLILATLRGLLLDLAATNDVARVSAAARVFAALLRDDALVARPRKRRAARKRRAGA